MKKRTTILPVNTLQQSMTLYKSLLAGLLLLIATGLSAQQTAAIDSLRGIIQDARTGEPIMAAKISEIGRAHV